MASAKIWVVGAMALAGISTAASYFHHRPAQQRQSVAVVEAPGASVAPPATKAELPQPRGLGWAVGNQYAQRFHYRASLVQGGDNPTATAPAKLTLALEGTWTSSVIEARDQLREVEIRVAPSRVQMSDDSESKLVHDELAQPFIVTYDHKGRALAIAFPKPPRLTTQNLIKDMVATFQFAGPQPAPRWSTLEVDPTGECLVAYTRKPDGSFIKQRIKYIRVASGKGLQLAEGAQVTPTIELSTGEFKLDGRERVATAQARTVVLMSVGDLGMTFRSDIEASLDLVKRTFDPALARRGAVAGLQRLDMTTPKEAYAEAETKSLQDVVQGARPAQIRAALAAARAAGNQDGIIDAQYQLSALVRLEPGALKELAGELRSKDLDPALLSALASAGTPQAQAAVLSVAADGNQAPELRQAAIETMHQLEEPTDATMTAVEKLAEAGTPEERKLASLAMGTLTQRQGEADPEGAAARVRKLAEAFDQAQSPDEQVRILDVLGNTANAAALPTFKKALAMEAVTVRAAAAGALRKIPEPEADALLAAVMESKDDPQVKDAALFAAGFRKFPPLAGAFERLLLGEANVDVRGRALDAVIMFLDRDGAKEALLLLAKVAKSDPADELRKSAAKALERGTRA